MLLNARKIGKSIFELALDRVRWSFRLGVYAYGGHAGSRPFAGERTENFPTQAKTRLELIG
jgi:hypothetical protein